MSPSVDTFIIYYNFWVLFKSPLILWGRVKSLLEAPGEWGSSSWSGVLGLGKPWGLVRMGGSSVVGVG